MSNTRSAAKQARGSLTRRAHNRSIKSRLHSLERKFAAAAAAKKADEAGAALRDLTSALDKAAKVQVVHPNMASRKKSRLAAQLKKALAPAAA